MSSAKADLTLQDAVKNTALHLACSKVRSHKVALCYSTVADFQYTLAIICENIINYIFTLHSKADCMALVFHRDMKPVPC